MNIEEIWLAYRHAIKGFLHKKVSNEADVEDLLQEILIKTHNNLATIKDQNSIKAWLFQVANNTIVDFYRKRGRQQDVDEAELAEHWHLEDSEDAKKALLNCLIPFIEALPQEQASLLKAIDIENQSQKEYAEALGLSYSTLKSRVQKSRTMLKAVYDNCCHFEVDRSGKVFGYEQKNHGRHRC